MSESMILSLTNVLTNKTVTTNTKEEQSIQPMPNDPKPNVKLRPIYLSSRSNIIVGYDTVPDAEEGTVGEIDITRDNNRKQQEETNITISLQQQADNPIEGKLKCHKKKVITLKQFRERERRRLAEKEKTRSTGGIMNRRSSNCLSEEEKIMEKSKQNQRHRKLSSQVELVDLIESSEDSEEEQELQIILAKVTNKTRRQYETMQFKDGKRGPSLGDDSQTLQQLRAEVDLLVEGVKTGNLPQTRESKRKLSKAEESVARKKVVKREPLFLDKHGNLDAAEFPYLETIKETIFHYEEESDFSTIEFSRELACTKFSPSPTRKSSTDPESPEVIAVIKHEVCEIKDEDGNQSDFPIDIEPVIPFLNPKFEPQPKELPMTPRATKYERYSRRSKPSPKRDVFKSPETPKGTLCNICGEFDTSRKELHSFLYEMQAVNRFKRFLCMTCNNRFAAAELDQHKEECYLISPDDIGFSPKTKKFRMMACETCAEMRKLM
ncbi:unnamed protein product [Orchesella dallaii]|uniref:Uncharacterized protein n=1 Tax=Orchesella dallaii TaxID=48710 RepID=A0ABP1QDQ2_9HEXA